MKTFLPALASLAVLILYACGGGQAPSDNDQAEASAPDTPAAAPSPVFSFAFIGCNRVNYGDRTNDTATDGSTANVAVLKKTLNDIAAQNPQPKHTQHKIARAHV